MRAADMLDVAVHHIGQTAHMKVVLGEVDGNAWLRLDSYSFMQVLGCLSQRLADEYNIGSVQLRVQAKDRWPGSTSCGAGTVMSTRNSHDLGAGCSAGGWRELLSRCVTSSTGTVGRCGSSETGPATRSFSVSAAVGWPQEPLKRHRVLAGGRPEYYDFDLFHVSEQSRQLDDRLLSGWCTPCLIQETTGLNPSQGMKLFKLARSGWSISGCWCKSRWIS